MKRFTILFIALLGIVAFTFAQTDYTMFDNTYLTVKTERYKEFNKAMSEHNKKFHSGDGPRYANVWWVNSGTNAGSFVWSMGPVTYTDMDSFDRLKEEHLNDWMFNVMPTIQSIDESSAWKRKDKFSYNLDDENFNKLNITFYSIESWQDYRFEKILEMVKNVYETKKYEHTFSVYYPESDLDNERDVAIVWGFNKWASFDEDPQFKKDFEEINGEGSWTTLMDEYKATVKGRTSEIWMLIPELSGNTD